jgi:hypothetical protein
MSISELLFCIGSILDCDAIFMLINDILCLRALSLSFVLYYHYVYKSERSSETHDPWSYFNHKKVLL